MLILVLLAAVAPVCCDAGPTVHYDGGAALNGKFQFIYSLEIPGDERLDPVTSSSSLLSGTMFTIYDVAGFDSAVAPANWSVSVQNAGVTPPLIDLDNSDDAALVNVTFFYTGPVVVPTDAIEVRNFKIISIYTATTPKNFSSQAMNQVNQLPNQLIGWVRVPAPTPGPSPGPSAPPISAAGLTAKLQTGPAAVLGGFQYDYTATLARGGRLDAGATAQENPAGTFFTIYDFAGFQGVLAMPLGWSYSTSFRGTTPSKVRGTSVDNGNVVNVTFFYNGSTTVGPTDFGPFQILSSIGNSQTGRSSSQSTIQFDSTTVQGVGSVVIPRIPLLELTSVTRPADGVFSISGRTESNLAVTIQAATNPGVAFTDIGEATADSSGSFSFRDTQAPGLSSRMYRAVLP